MNKKLLSFTCASALAVGSISASSAVLAVKAADNSVQIVNKMASPNWQDQIIYFLMTDRFANGDKSNDDQGKGEYGPVESKYNGGDLQGVIDKEDYIKKLGATAIWITPPVANQWWEGTESGGYGGYHGYWAENFKAVDKHLGTLDTYKELVKKYHQNKMYVIQDIVCNHTANFFSYSSYDPKDVTKGWYLNPSVPVTAPTQYPFNENDPNKYLKDAIYHFTPDITDYKDQNQAYNYQCEGLDDLNTENPVVINALKDSYRYWIKEVGVDGYRIDTAKYVPYAFWKDFIHSTDKDNLGIKNYAATQGKNNFLTFGEIWDTSNKYVGSYTKDNKGNPLIDSALDFPLQDTLSQVFKQGKPTSAFEEDIKERNNSTYQNPYELVTFIDNHDMARWLNGGNINNMQQALAAIMTIPGIPCIYQGTEQEFTEPRAAMFKDGYASGGKDHYDENSDMYKFLQKLIKVRKSNKVFSRGTVKVIKDSKTSSGILAYEMLYNHQKALVVYNTSMTEKIMNNVTTDLNSDSKLNLLLSNDTNSGLNNIVTTSGGKVSAELNPGKFAIFMEGKQISSKASNEAGISVDNLAKDQVLSDNYLVKGTAKNATDVSVIIDGNVDKASKATVENDQWSYNIDLSELSSGEHTLIIKAAAKDGSFAATDDVTFKVQSQSGAGDLEAVEGKAAVVHHNGPDGKYAYPTDKSYTKQMTINAVNAKSEGSDLVLTLNMNDLTQTWSPTNGFDHVYFTVFLQDPKKGETGATVMPKQNSNVPVGFKWNYELLAGGWDNKMFSSDGAAGDKFGTSIASAAKIKADAVSKSITLTIPKEALGNPDSFKDWKVYVSTWDYDGMSGSFRPIMKAAEDYKFGGGSTDNSEEPYIMDDVEPFALTAAASNGDNGNSGTISAIATPGDITHNGPDGKYIYPKEKTFDKQMTINGAEVKQADSNLEFDLKMGNITQSWSPTNKFDHVYYTIFIQDPSKADSGETVMPYQYAKVPDGFKWNYELFVGGWDNKMFSSTGAKADKWGSSMPASAKIDVNQADKIIKLTVPGDAFGNPKSYKGWKVYITTWDYDGMSSSFRVIMKDAQDYKFGGAASDDVDGPLVMDSVKPLTLN